MSRSGVQFFSLAPNIHENKMKNDLPVSSEAKAEQLQKQLNNLLTAVRDYAWYHGPSCPHKCHFDECPDVLCKGCAIDLALNDVCKYG